MNIVFMGSPEFAIPSLEKIYHSSHTISAVVSNADKKRGRGSKATPTPVKAKALELGLPVIDVENLKSNEFAEQLKNLNPDLFVVVAFRILPLNILEIPNIGSVNLHASLLPKYRGAAPIHWAVMNGETETGCTVFFLDEDVDTGKIIAQKKISIGEMETTGDIYEKLRFLGSDILLNALNSIEAGNIKAVEQRDEFATPAPKLFKEDAHIDFNRPVTEIHNKIRGLSPFPTAWADWNGRKFNIYKAKPGPAIEVKSGELFEKNKRLLVGGTDGTIELLEVQLPGTKRLSGPEFISGYEAKGFLK